jgi:hypothetical protein
MTLIAMCERVLAEVGWPVPSAIATNTDATAKQILAIANTELRMLSQGYEWPHLEVDYQFNTVAAQAQYPWPDDFRKLSFGSVFDASQYYGVRGSMNIERWQKYKNGLLGSLSHQKFRQTYVAGVPTMELTPTPTDVRSMVALYVTKEYARDAGGTSKEMYTADTDVSKVPEELVELGVKWRFRRAKGLDFSVELAEYNSQVKQQYAGYKALGDIPVGGGSYDDGLTSGYVPDNGFGA